MLSILDTYNATAVHKSQTYQQLKAQTPGFDEKNPQHMMGMQQALHKFTYDVGLYTLGGESLLARARNHMAAVCLQQGFDKLFFIDADTGWNWDQFKAIVDSPHPITAGVVPLKTYVDFPRTFKTSLNFLPFQEDEKYFTRAVRDLEGTIKMAEGHGSPLVKVAFTGTGYLCIDSSVFLKMAETAAPFLYPDPQTGETTTHWSFFDGGPINETYMSEDWQFIAAARNAGFDSYIHTDIRLTHTGPQTFVAG